MNMKTVHFIPASLVYGKKVGKIICPQCGMSVDEIENTPHHRLTSSSYAYKHMNHNYRTCDDDGEQDTSSSDAKQGGLVSN